MSDLTLFIGRVRSRWQRLRALRAWTASALAAGLVVVVALAIDSVLRPGPRVGAGLWSVGVLTSLACVFSIVRVVRGRPSDLQLARLIEERCPDLEDALVTAVGADAAAVSPLTEAVRTDAVARLQRVPLGRVISSRALGRGTLAALAASLLLLVSWGIALGPAVHGIRLAAFYLMPGRFGLVVTPGDARVPAGQPLELRAQLPVVAEGSVPAIRIEDGDRSREVAMEARGDGFALVIAQVDRDFRYTVLAAGVTSRAYTITALYPPRVERVSLHYEFPAAFGMEPRDEPDGGDMYGPVGTRVHVSIQADKPVVAGALTLPEGTTVPLTAMGNRLEGDVTITGDASYRIALSDADGLTSGGDVEYFIRTLEDRPPDVRIVQPASDRRATPLEEVTIEARADDDFGVATFDLVYAIKGQAERVVPFARAGAGLSVSGKQTIYLEDLGVQPGDFVTYYARASDVSRGKRSTEARSDMFFLEVAPFDQEFVVSDEQGGGGGGGDQGIADMIEAQKVIVTSTWTLDRRIRETGGRSEADIAAIAKAQADLRRRTLSAAAQAQRGADLRRRRNGVRPPAGPVPLEESDDAVGRAADAMLQAERQLETLKTSAAIPFEMDALNELMRADADVRRREIQRQQTAGGGGEDGRRQQDLSSLFDKELARDQTNSAETSNGGEPPKKDSSSQTLDKVRDLARRQDALNREQGADSRASSAAERRRQLERLTREQVNLKQQADDLARQLGEQGGGASSNEGTGTPRRVPAGGQDARETRSQAGGGDERDSKRAVEQIAEDMNAAANELRRQDRATASTQGTRALERLRELEQELSRSASQGRQGGTAPDESAAARRLTEELAQLRDLRERLEALDQELDDLSGARPQANEGSGDPWEKARQLDKDAKRALGESPVGGGFNPGRSDPGTEPWKQDMSRWETLNVQLQVALEKAEASAAARLRKQRATDRLNAGASQSVPETYRRLVERYFRGLAGDRRP